MIKKAVPDDFEDIFSYISQDFARNYFIALGLLKGADTFKDIYIERSDTIRAILFHRTSNNLQFVAYDDFDVVGFSNLLEELHFDSLISPKSFCQPLEHDLIISHEGAIIASLKKMDFQHIMPKHNVKVLTTGDVDAVEKLYKKRFVGYPKASFMKEKLLCERGIGFYCENGEMVSVAQSELGYVIVGVATEESYEGSGYASSCLITLIEALFKSHDELFLQYDNPLAGLLYEKMGFKPIDRVIHYKKR